MSRPITLDARLVNMPQESDFMRIQYPFAIPGRVMSNIDHVCGQY